MRTIVVRQRLSGQDSQHDCHPALAARCRCDVRPAGLRGRDVAVDASDRGSPRSMAALGRLGIGALRRRMQLPRRELAGGVGT